MFLSAEKLLPLAEIFQCNVCFFPTGILWRCNVPFSLMKGGLQSDRPQPQVIIPSAAFGGSIISFVLCPSELVKVHRSFLISC